MEESNSDEEGSNSGSIILDKVQREYVHTKKDNVLMELSEETVKRNAEQRKEREDDNSTEDDNNAEEDFITVVRRKNKRLIRSDSLDLINETRVDKNKSLIQSEETTLYEVCLTSKESVPKQMALAKLLRSENIKGITRIKYKSFNKVLIQFQSNEDADKLL